MTNYIFDFKCPRCGYVCILTLPNREPPPLLDCPFCLTNESKSIELTVERVTVMGDGE